MKNIFCPRCHKKTKYLYRLNDGIYCDHDYEAGLIRQDMKMRCILTVVALLMIVAVGCEPRDQVHWEAFTQEKLSTAAQAGKPVVAYFYAAWCGPCMALKYETFTDSRVIQSLEPFARLKADLSFSHSEKSEEIMQAYQIAGFPTVIFFNPSGKEVARFSGFIDPEQFLSFLDQHSLRFQNPLNVSNLKETVPTKNQI